MGCPSGPTPPPAPSPAPPPTSPTAPPPGAPSEVSCFNQSVGKGLLAVSATVDSADVALVDFALSGPNDPAGWTSVHYTVPVTLGAPLIHGVVPDLIEGALYEVFARSLKRRHSEGDPTAWTKLTTFGVLCQASTVELVGKGAKDKAATTSQGRIIDIPDPSTRWLEVYRVRGPGFTGTSSSGDFSQPDFLDNHNSGSSMTLLGDLGVSWQCITNPTLASNCGLSRYCVEMLDIELTRPKFNIGGEQITSPFAPYLSSDHGRLHCPDRTDANDCLAPLSLQQSACGPSKLDQCTCPNSAMQLGQKYTGACNVTYGGGEDYQGLQQQYSHPEVGACSPHANVGDDGCTWKRAPLVHTVSVQRLIDAGSLVEKNVRDMSLAEHLKSLTNGMKVFESVGAKPCGTLAKTTFVVV